jgi:Sulfotransferase family
MHTPERFAGSSRALHAAARAAIGLHDFGPCEEYAPGLECLLEALDHDGPRFAPGGRDTVKGALVGLLVTRLFAEQQFKDRRDALSRPIVRPLIITGVPRTGTTALHKLLSMDHQFQGLERWLTVFPMPRPPRRQWPGHPLYRSVVDGLEAFFQSAPEMRAAHNMVADDIDECLEVLKQNFCSNNFGSSWRVPAYDRWWLQQSEQASYRRLARVIRLVGAEDSRPWLLKNPGHIKELGTLLEVFPDACVVQTHRDPVKALPSLCSVLQMARAVVEGGNVQPAEIGARELENWARATEAAMAARERLPARQFLDVQHHAFHADPMAVVRSIYEHFGFALSAMAEQRMRERIRADPEGRFGEHRYSAEAFGLHPQQIRERFAAYMDRYGLK